MDDMPLGCPIRREAWKRAWALVSAEAWTQVYVLLYSHALELVTSSGKWVIIAGPRVIRVK